MEDARSLAGLAMEVYSDRISVDQEEQERLRFSPDDIVKLPVHRALNLWVAAGVPRPGFLAETLPMEQLRDEELAADHAGAQHRRGGHHPDHLPDPLAQGQQQAEAAANAAHARRSSRRAGHRVRDETNAGAAASTASAGGLQLPLEPDDNSAPESLED